ncbi:MAG TPA: DUF302 domain-containing protein [Balneolales bacterium]|jgi:uncharacterized protein (DUF302 family)|nr:DUF302 domain-containing protein [Balneolales bacterium]
MYSKQKRTLFSTIILLTVLAVVGINPAYSQSGPGIVKVESSKNFDQTISAFKKMVSGNGMMVMGQLNQGKVLSMTGISVKSHTFFVGNPSVGKKLFSADHAAGAAVPVRVNIYEDTNGHTYVAYIPPSEELSSLNNQKIDMVAKMLDQKLHKLTSMLGK